MSKKEKGSKKKSFKNKISGKFKNKDEYGIKLYDGITYIIQVFVIALIAYFVVIYTAVGFIPYIGGMLIQAMNITLETALMDLFILWMVPCLFVIFMLFVFELVCFKLLWKFLNKIFGKLRAKHKKEVQEKHTNKNETE